jgi:carboxypeptidase PM20D1
MMLKNVFFVLPVLVAVLLYRASYLPKRQGEFALPAGHEVPTFGLDEAFHAAARKRLVRALKIKTVSYDAYTMSYPENFKELHAELERSFPLVHEHCEREVVSEYSLVFKWSSALPAAQKKAPIMLMSHMDVVPAIEGDESQWEYEPFAGMVIDSYIYGRGTMDDKMGVMGIMEGYV